MNYMDDPFSRDLRRIEVARRLVFHQVRTQTIVEYTSLTRNRLATLRRRWCVAENSRRRGPPPRSIAVFLRTPWARSEAAAIISLCMAFDALPHQLSKDRAKHPPLVIADRLCEAFEAFRTWIPQSKIDFEELLLLATELASGDLIRLSTCRECKSVVLILRYEKSTSICLHCDRHSKNTLVTQRTDR
jgi:hypothetical protein